MNDPKNEELISAYLDGELSTEEQAQVERLLAEKPELRRWCDEMAAMRSRLQALPRRRMGSDFAAAIAKRAQQAVEDQAAATPAVSTPAAGTPAAPTPAVKTPAEPVAAPLAATPQSRKDEPEVAPARWPFANVPPRMLFWPLAALAAALAIMFFESNPIAPLTEVADTRQLDDGTTAAKTTNDFVDLSKDRNMDGVVEHLTDQPVDRPVKNATDRLHAFGLENGRKAGEKESDEKATNESLASGEPVTGLGAVVRPARSRGPHGGPGATDDFGTNGAKDFVTDLQKLNETDGELYFVEVVVPAGKEESYKLALARRNIKLEDHTVYFGYSLEAKGVEKPARYGNTVHTTKLNPGKPNIDELSDMDADAVKVITETYREKQREGSKDEWFYVAAAEDNLLSLLGDLEAQGSRVTVWSDEAEDSGLKQKAGDATAIAGRVGRFAQRMRLGLLRSAEEAEVMEANLPAPADLALIPAGSTSNPMLWESLNIPAPPDIVLEAKPPLPLVAGIAPTFAPPVPVVPATTPAPGEKPAESKPQDNRPLSQSTARLEDDHPPVKLAERELKQIKDAEGLEFKEVQLGRAWRLRDLAEVKARYSRQSGIGGVSGTDGGENGQARFEPPVSAHGGGVESPPKREPNSDPTRGVIPKPLQTVAGQAVSGKEPGKKEEPKATVAGDDFARFDERLGVADKKNARKGVRLVVVFRREPAVAGPALPALPADPVPAGAPAAESAPPSTKK